MKKVIYALALILGIGGTAVAQSCGGGYNGGGSNYYTSNVSAVGKVKFIKRGFSDRLLVTDARLIQDRGNKITLEYFLENGDKLTIMAKKARRHGGGNHHNPHAYGASHNYYYGSSNNFDNGAFEVHCVRLNGRTLPLNCGTLRIDRGWGRYANTSIDIELRRGAKWKGNAEVRLNRNRY